MDVSQRGQGYWGFGKAWEYPGVGHGDRHGCLPVQDNL